MDADAKKQKGIFKGDVLVEGLGPEKPGRTRGVGVFAPWKTGRDWTVEDKRECKKIKKELEIQKIRADFKAEIVAEVLAELKAKGERPPSPSPDPDPLARRSSCASRVVTADTDAISYPCDHIEVIKPIDQTKYIYIK